jgi:predicted nucleic acid-binding protein
MILADTSIWIDFFHDVSSTQTFLLKQALLQGEIVMGDLVLVEILQGLKRSAQVKLVSAALTELQIATLCGPEIAPLAAANYRALRSKGITVRGTIDVIIATWCIENHTPLLHNDRDLQIMEDRLGLPVWR